ncbi:hypothetical protein GW17_00014185 [Ensete ventricosum]|nr:hypothetical protein GW17_00014185 [Ensete ventricosum]
MRTYARTLRSESGSSPTRTDQILASSDPISIVHLELLWVINRPPVRSRLYDEWTVQIKGFSGSGFAPVVRGSDSHSRHVTNRWLSGAQIERIRAKGETFTRARGDFVRRPMARIVPMFNATSFSSNSVRLAVLHAPLSSSALAPAARFAPSPRSGLCSAARGTLSPLGASCLCILQLLADYGVDQYDIGGGFGHFGIAVEDVRSLFMYQYDKGNAYAQVFVDNIDFAKELE